MVGKRRIRWLALMLTVLVASTAFGSGLAGATELDDYRWERRPLLVFAPTDNDPQLVETLGRIEADRCDFVSRDMVLGVLVTEGTSTLDGKAMDAEESQRLAQRYGLDDNAFGVLLIGKDGGEKLRVNDVPDLRAIYALIDGMPMRRGEMRADPGRC
ncbi:DUF4174 domain-containing protein [Mycolicibacterium psychrotolerans]|uniref:DUF4174 domain-containing protein n=1 Tax=Mycolicibacterium psychrotolerans TaxID=216929 RepID=A0A7I7M6G0_9MYCO|nr:DUF4174 domain-containing protein [Mycolicibacterium psychrotolerans]BBX67462.1 hypothetical protein MPSYJ_09230 [Mycolicibacterium psychrotolerans]